MQLLLADAGPLIALAVAEVLPACLAHFELQVPEAVITECTFDPYAPGAQMIQQCLEHTSFKQIPNAAILPLDAAYALGLGSGEAAVLSYAVQHQLLALIDERRARAIAQRLAVKVIGTGAVVVALKQYGAIASIQPVLARWQSHGYFVSKPVQAQLLRLAGE